MTFRTTFKKARMALATATALTIGLGTIALPLTTAQAQVKTQRATGELVLSKGRGQLINLPENIADVFVSNEAVADVRVRSARQIYVFGKEGGETSVFATNRNGGVVYSANVRVGNNANSLDQMLKLAMPEADINTNSMSGLVLLTGTVASPEDVSEAERLVKAYVGDDKVQVVSRLKTATPLQVSLHVKIAEVSRDFTKQIGMNLASLDYAQNGFLLGATQGRSFVDVTQEVRNGVNTVVRDFGQLRTGSGTALAFGGRFLGMDLLGALDLAENDGLVTTLAQPNLTALSGETASFLAGGEIPIPLLQGTGNGVTVEYKQYGISLSFTPIVLADGRISMRVRPEVSQLTSAGSVALNGFSIPALSTRRTETTVELGSGQSIVIGGLLTNNANTSVDKAPFLGDVPILGALFRSNKFRRSESELMVVVTPYLVKPVSANQIKLPTDGLKAPTDFEQVGLGKTFVGETGASGEFPKLADPVTVPENGDAGQSKGKKANRSRRSPKAEDMGVQPGFDN